MSPRAVSLLVALRDHGGRCCTPPVFVCEGIEQSERSESRTAVQNASEGRASNFHQVVPAWPLSQHVM
jgi:hypothetical protein